MLQWAAETELDAVTGGAQRGGRFRVDVSTATDRQAAMRDREALRRAGYPASLATVKGKAGPVHRVRIVNLSSERDAQAVADKVKALGFSGAAVGK